jgi:hypothetical protein
MSKQEDKTACKDCYLAMFSFLENHYELTKSDDIAVLLGSMSIMNDGKPVDKAILAAWNRAIINVCENKADACFKILK